MAMNRATRTSRIPMLNLLAEQQVIGGELAAAIQDVVGSGQFIPGFEEGLIGAKAGDERAVKATFPAEYPMPHLAGKEAESGTLTTASTDEQRGAGLDQCSKEELQRLRQLNHDYRARFGFPFVVAVKGLSRHEIMDQVEARLTNDRDTEFRTCLNEIGKIARFRLDALFANA